MVAGLLERDIFDLFLPEFDKPWVIHLRENLLLFYKPLLLEAQHCLQERRGKVDIIDFHLLLMLLSETVEPRFMFRLLFIIISPLIMFHMMSRE